MLYKHCTSCVNEAWYMCVCVCACGWVGESVCGCEDQQPSYLKMSCKQCLHVKTDLKWLTGWITVLNKIHISLHALFYGHVGTWGIFKCMEAQGEVGAQIIYQPKTILHIYITCIRPHLEYACQLWDPYTNKDAQLLEDVQKFACKVCLKQWNLDYHSMLCLLGLPDWQFDVSIWNWSQCTIL